MVQPRAGSTAAWCDRLLDTAVLLLATWTLVYHLCVLLRLGTTGAVVLELAALVVAVGVRLRLGEDTTQEAPAAGDHLVADPPLPAVRRLRMRPLLAVTVGAAVVTAIATAVGAPWVLVWVPWLVASLTGSWWAGTWLAGRSVPDPGPPPVEGRWTAGGVLAWAFGLGLYAMWTQRPNPDDLFYINYSQWVAGHGAFPVKDTLFSNLAYPMANWPPVASYDALVGVVARIVHAHAASVEYILVPPVATTLSVLALWRLLRAWRVRHLLWLLSTALVFLLFDGTASYATPGNLFLTRLWQGKVVLLCVVVPVLLVHALRYVEDPRGRRLLPLALGGVAAVGLSTTGIFLVPILAVAAMAPLALRTHGRSRALAGFLALATYPLLAGVVTLALGGRSADDFGTRRLYRFDAAWIGHQMLLSDLLGLVVVLAMLLGALLVPHPQARLTTGLMVLFTGYVFVPGAMRVSYDVSGLGPTLWRISWAAGIAALVGVLAVYGGSRVTRWVLERHRGGSWRTAATPVACVVTMGLLAAFGPPIWSPDTGTRIRTPLHWQRSSSSRALTEQILSVTRPGDLVLAPEALSITIAVTTTSVKTVAPRDYYMHYLRDDPTFHYPERLSLVRFVNHDNPRDTPGIARDLRVVGVQVACTRIQDRHRYDTIRAAGYRPLFSSSYYRCLRRT